MEKAATGLPEAATASGLAKAAAASEVRDQKKQLDHPTPTQNKQAWAQEAEEAKLRRLEKLARIQDKAVELIVSEGAKGGHPRARVGAQKRVEEKVRRHRPSEVLSTCGLCCRTLFYQRRLRP